MPGQKFRSIEDETPQQCIGHQLISMFWKLNSVNIFHRRTSNECKDAALLGHFLLLDGPSCSQPDTRRSDSESQPITCGQVPTMSPLWQQWHAQELLGRSLRERPERCSGRQRPNWRPREELSLLFTETGPSHFLKRCWMVFFSTPQLKDDYLSSIYSYS